MDELKERRKRYQSRESRLEREMRDLQLRLDREMAGVNRGREDRRRRTGSHTRDDEHRRRRGGSATAEHDKGRERAREGTRPDDTRDGRRSSSSSSSNRT
ncbi:hypothetical protein COOONC_02912 [Cooperia oncophora]